MNHLGINLTLFIPTLEASLTLFKFFERFRSTFIQF
jgi:hypothetical protein